MHEPFRSTSGDGKAPAHVGFLHDGFRSGWLTMLQTSLSGDAKFRVWGPNTGAAGVDQAENGCMRKPALFHAASRLEHFRLFRAR